MAVSSKEVPATFSTDFKVCTTTLAIWLAAWSIKTCESSDLYAPLVFRAAASSVILEVNSGGSHSLPGTVNFHHRVVDDRSADGRPRLLYPNSNSLDGESR